MKLEFKKLDDKAQLPKRANPLDAGLDLTATSREKLRDSGEDTIVEYGTGLAVAIPEGHVGLLFPRSSVTKKDMSLANCVGVIDAGYRGELKLRFRRYAQEDYQIGERVGQLVIVPVLILDPVEVVELKESQRGAGGFGSSGN